MISNKLRMFFFRHRILDVVSAAEHGQAAVEYAIMTATLLAAGTVTYPFLLRFAPDMINALQIYVDGFYFVFSLPIP